MQRIPRIACFAVAFGGLLTPVASAQATKNSIVDDGIVIENVTLISSERQAPLTHAFVFIRNGRIAQIGTHLAVGPHAKRIDGRNRFLIPGLIDSHVHVDAAGDDAIDENPEMLPVFQAQLPRAYLAFGFTTLVDLNSRKQARARVNAAPVQPTLYSCAPAVHTVGGYGAHRLPKDAAGAEEANLIYEPAQAKDWPAFLDPRDYTPARAVDRVVQAGGVCVKVFYETGFGGLFHWPVPSAETLAALRAETRRRGLVLVMHANAVESWRAAVEAHADVIAHGLWHWPGDRLVATPPADAREVIRAAARAGIGVQPTLQVVYGDESIFDNSLLDDPRFAEALPHAVIAYLKGDAGQAASRAIADEYRQMMPKLFPTAAVDPAKVIAIGAARASATLRLMQEEKVKLLLGSDTPSGDGGIGNPPGFNGRLELTRWFEAGVPLSLILRAATLDNAVVFGLSKDRGTIEVGKRADLLLLRADPLKTIAAYDAIDTIFLNGDPIPRASLLPPN